MCRKKTVSLYQSSAAIINSVFNEQFAEATSHKDVKINA